MKEFGAKNSQKNGRRYSVISAPSQTLATSVRGFRGKSVCIVFYERKPMFTQGVKEFAAATERFAAEGCVVIVATAADSSWATWSTSVGLTLMGEMAAASIDKIREEAFIPDPASYDIPTVSLVMLDHQSCVRHVMTTSLEPNEAVESAIDAARIIKDYKLPDPVAFRTTVRERKFEKQNFDKFKRQSFYEMQLNTESGQIRYLGEATLDGQCHVPFHGNMLSQPTQI